MPIIKNFNPVLFSGDTLFNAGQVTVIAEATQRRYIPLLLKFSPSFLMILKFILTMIILLTTYNLPSVASQVILLQPACLIK